MNKPIIAQLRGTNEELRKQYDDCVTYLENYYLKKKRGELEKLFEETKDVKLLGEIKDINRRMKDGGKTIKKEG